MTTTVNGARENTMQTISLSQSYRFAELIRNDLPVEFRCGHASALDTKALP